MERSSIGFFRRTHWCFLDVVILVAVVCLVTMQLGLVGRFVLHNTLYWKQVSIFVTILLFFLWFFSAFYLRLNRPQSSLTRDIFALFNSILVSSLAMSAVYFLFKTWRPGYTLPFIIGGVLFVFLATVRIVEWRFFRQKKQMLAVFVALEPYWESGLAEFCEKLPSYWSMASAFMETESPMTQGIMKLTNDELANFITFCEDNSFVPLLIMGQVLPDEEKFNRFIQECYSNGLSTTDIGSFYEGVLEKIPLFRQDGHWVTQSAFVPPAKWRFICKRLFDTFFALLLLVPTLPVLALLAIAVRKESKGPAFFVQERVGKDRKPFKMIKLRTMRLHDDDSLQWPNVAEDLITPLGKVLRKTGLDELPQLFNILMGQMSFIGPRPARPIVSQRHATNIPHYALCYPLLPGISGWAQLHLGRDTGVNTVFEKVMYTLYYAKHFSIFLDMKIVLTTAKMLLTLNKLEPELTCVVRKGREN
nr:sugar transferase [uncultured Pseudodesulfovibrio sp.]